MKKQFMQSIAEIVFTYHQPFRLSDFFKGYTALRGSPSPNGLSA